MTPSLPTRSIARAMRSPTSRSPFADTVPTCATSSWPWTFRLILLSSVTTAAVAISMPRRTSMGFIPAATAFVPSRTIDCASTVAVVRSVASDIIGLAGHLAHHLGAHVFETCPKARFLLRRSRRPWVVRGAPNDLSSTTLRPLGPRVTLTALARTSTPRSMRSRASPENLTSLGRHVCEFLLCGMTGPGLGQDSHDVGLFDDDVFLAIHLDFSARPLADQDGVALLHIQGRDLAIFAPDARTQSR